MRVAKRRRRENKTDYSNRMKLLKSLKPRLVFRRTNKYFIVQYVVSQEAKDKIILGASSKDLVKYGWPKEASGSLKSVTASYLLGYLVAKKIISEKMEKPVVDFGMMRVLHKSKPFGFIKGLIDGGLDIPCPEEAFPEEERIKGRSLKGKINFEEIKSKIGGK